VKVLFSVEIYVQAPEGHFSNKIGGIFTKEVEMAFCPPTGTIVDLGGLSFGLVVSDVRWSENKPHIVVYLERPTERNCRKFLEEINELRKLGWK